MQVSGLHHIGYVVPRMGPALSRFMDEGARIVVEPVDDPVQGVTVALVLADSAIPIELVAPTSNADSPITARLRRGGGFDHLCYSVGNVPGSLAEEAERGSLIVCEPVFAVAFNRTIGFVQRRSGMVVEYISNDEVGAPPEEISAAS